MTTRLKYKQLLLSDCEKAKSKEKKLKCIEDNVHLVTGKVNYLSYRGQRKQNNLCRRLESIDGCKAMCVAFFQFWPEPSRKECSLVETKWIGECNLRVDLIEQRANQKWDDA